LQELHVKIYLEIPCPKCQRKLRVPTEYLGKRLTCKYCEVLFKPEAKDAPAGAATVPADSSAAAANQQITALQAQLQSVRAELAARVADLTNAVKDTQWARAEATRLQEEMQALANAADKVDSRHRLELENRQEQLAAVTAETERLRTLLAELESKQGDSSQAARTEATQLQEELTAAQASCRELAAQLAAAAAAHADLDRSHADAQRAYTEESETKLQAAQAQAAAQCQRLQQELESLQRQFTEEKTALQHAAEETREGAAALRQEHEAALQLLDSTKKDCERLTAAHGELQTTHHQTKESLHGELERLNVHHDELMEQLRGVHGERATLESALEGARGELESRKAEATQMEEQVRALQAAAEEAEARHRQDTADRQRALQAVRREVLDLRARADHLPLREQENEQLIGENASLAAELAAAQEELETLRQAAEEAEARQFDEDEHRHKTLVSVRTEAAKLLEQVKALEARSQEAQALEARLQEAWTVTTRLEGELALANAARHDLRDRLAAAESQAQQLATLRAERDQLAEQVKALQADLVHHPGKEGASFKSAIEAAFAEVVRPRGEPSTNEKMARALADPQRSAMANEVARLKQENAQLRQWLAQCGVLPM
jgi:chromosome segregation ATPase